MPLDAVCLRAVLRETRPALLGARIEKIQQPARDRIVLSMRGGQRLLLCANPNQPRLHWTRLSLENPAQPPMFCMLLRKHLSGARIVAAEQPDLERTVTLTLQATNEWGESGERRLILEAMGRRANLILCDGDGRILDCLRRVDFERAGDRQLLPGLFYRPPAPMDRLSPLAEPDAVREAAVRLEASETRLDQWLVARLAGVSPLIAREIAQRAAGTPDARLCDLRLAERAALLREIDALIDTIKENRFTPYMLLRDGRPVEFSYRAITQYGPETAVETRESFSELLDEFYAERERRELAERRGRELTRAASVARDRMARKTETLKKELEATRDRDQLRLCGELITANLYRMARGQSSLTAENYYADGAEVTIPLDPLLTPQQNAARYFKRYQKAKNAESHLREQIEKAEAEHSYLESVMQELRQAEAEQEFEEIRRELQATGYLRRGKDGKERKALKRAFAPREFRSSGGFRILVGRSNGQNDQLTQRMADRRDLWFHTQRIHGSHVILCTEGRTPDEASMVEAAKLAAWYSQSREGENVPVDYTAVRNVKKPSGARPGMVIYESYRTLYVTPEKELPERLAAGRQP